MQRVYGKRLPPVPSTLHDRAGTAADAESEKQLAAVETDGSLSKRPRGTLAAPVVTSAAAPSSSALQVSESQQQGSSGVTTTSRSVVHRAGTLIASGLAAAQLQDLHYHIDGLESDNRDVRHSSVLWLAESFSERSMRDVARRHGVVHRIATAASRVAEYTPAPVGSSAPPATATATSSKGFKLHWGSNDPGRPPAPLDCVLALGIIVLMFALDADGDTLECMTPGCVHLLLRYAATASAGIGGGARPAVAAPPGFDSALAVDTAVPDGTPVPGRVVSRSGIFGSASSVSIQRSTTDAAVATEARLLSLLSELGAVSAKLEGAGALLLPRGPPGSSTPAPRDVALYLLWRVTHVPTEDDCIGALDVSDAGDVIRGATAGGDASMAAIAAAVGATRDAVPTAMQGYAPALLVAELFCAGEAASLWLRGGLSAPPASPMQATRGKSVSSTVRSAAAVALASIVAPRFVAQMRRCLLLLRLLEDISFSGEQNAGALLACRVASSPGHEWIICCCAKGSERREVDLVSLLIGLSDAALTFLGGHHFLPSEAEGGATTGSSRIPEHHPAFEVLLACLRVLVNLSNDNPTGCTSVMSAHAFVGNSSCSDAGGGSSAGTGLAFPMRLLRIFWAAGGRPVTAASISGNCGGMEGSLTAGGITQSRLVHHPVSVRSSDEPAVKGEHGSAVAHPGLQPHAWFDALVLACGLLTNVVEHSADARRALSHSSWGVPLPEGLPYSLRARAATAERVLSSFSACESGAVQRVEKHQPVAPLLLISLLFVTRFSAVRGLHAAATAHGDVSQVRDGDQLSSDTTKPDMADVPIDADDLVVAGYAAMLLGVAMRRNRTNQIAVLRIVDALLPAEPSNPTRNGVSPLKDEHGFAPSRDHPAISAVSATLRAFVALQGAVGILTEEGAATVAAVHERLASVQQLLVDGTASHRAAESDDEDDGSGDFVTTGSIASVHAVASSKFPTQSDHIGAFPDWQDAARPDSLTAASATPVLANAPPTPTGRTSARLLGSSEADSRDTSPAVHAGRVAWSWSALAPAVAVPGTRNNEPSASEVSAKVASKVSHSGVEVASDSISVVTSLRSDSGRFAERPSSRTDAELQRTPQRFGIGALKATGLVVSSRPTVSERQYLQIISPPRTSATASPTASLTERPRSAAALRSVAPADSAAVSYSVAASPAKMLSHPPPISQSPHGQIMDAPRTTGMETQAPRVIVGAASDSSPRAGAAGDARDGGQPSAAGSPDDARRRIVAALATSAERRQAMRAGYPPKRVGQQPTSVSASVLATADSRDALPFRVPPPPALRRYGSSRPLLPPPAP